MMLRPVFKMLICAVAMTTVVACSLGTAVTPDCDPSAPPNAENACAEVSKCDSGNGIIQPTVTGCCEAYAQRAYEQCVGKYVTALSDVCSPTSSENCCVTARIEEENCEAGMIGSSTSASGGAGGN